MLGGQPGLAAAARAAWMRTSDPQRGAEFRLFFAVHGRALQALQQFAGFLERVVADWMSALVDAQGPDTDPGERDAHGHTSDRDDPRAAA